MNLDDFRHLEGADLTDQIKRMSRDALSALDSVLVASADAETVKFLLDSAKAKLWRHAYVDA